MFVRGREARGKWYNCRMMKSPIVAGLAVAAVVIAGCGRESAPAAKAVLFEHQTPTVRGTAAFVVVCGDAPKYDCLLAASECGARAIAPYPPDAILIDANADSLARMRKDGRFREVRELRPEEKLAPGADDLVARVVVLAEFDLKRMSDFVRANGGTLIDDADCGKLEFAARLPRKLAEALARQGEVRAIRRE